MYRILALLCVFMQAGFARSDVDPTFLEGLHWRLAGPFRGGRALAVTGVPGHPEQFYFGAVGGGVWFSPNAGRTWTPIFDKVSTASIGAIAVAPSDSKVIYVGAGEADMRSDIQQGDGMYKSVDGGKSWSHIGLTDSRQIGKILVDPHNPNLVYVAALGHQYGPNSERGVFRSLDGGSHWKKCLYKDSNTGAIDLDMDPTDSKTLYASLWQTRRPPWSIYPPSNGPGSGLYKSVDGGVTWQQLLGRGFPNKVGRIGISCSPAREGRIYTCVDGLNPSEGGVYRSDDGGTNWRHVGSDSRIWGRGWYFMGITADPKDPDLLYVMNTSAYRSTDGGKTWIAFKGAPGGDDYHTCWIEPNDPSHMIIGCDQGVIVSVDKGRTWSSWYNQPTGQFYHIVTDNRFPYWIYGSQQDSGAMAIPSRTIHTGISALYQRPIDAGGESGTIAVDRLHPGMLLSSTGSRESVETGWEQSIDPTQADPDTDWRSEWTQPIAASPTDPHVFYTSHQKVFESSNGGSSWKVISPDLTRNSNPKLPNLDAPTAADNDGAPRRGVVYWLAPSPLKKGLLWAGTDDGLIWLTHDDGSHWTNVTPKQLSPWSKVGIIDASHFDKNTSYAAIDRHRLDDNHPYIYKTTDNGKSWWPIVDGIPSNQFVNVVREDPRQPGLLYAGTDWGMFVSFNSGRKWQSLQLNLPAASIRDIVFGDNEVIAGTHGRAIWILNADPLRALAAGEDGDLFKPGTAMLFQRAGTFGFGRFDEGTPLPPEEPQGENPAWGASIYYRLPKGTRSVTLKIFDENGEVIRKISSSDRIPRVDFSKMDIPSYWDQPPMYLSSTPGGHVYNWDLRQGSSGAPLAPPGSYSVVLQVDGKSFRQPLRVVRDPRLPVTDQDLREQYRFALRIEHEVDQIKEEREEALALLKRTTNSARIDRLRSVAGVGRIVRRRRVVSASKDHSSFTYLAGALEGLEGSVESAEALPTRQSRAIFSALIEKAQANSRELRALQRQLNR